MHDFTMPQWAVDRVLERRGKLHIHDDIETIRDRNWRIGSPCHESEPTGHSKLVIVATKDDQAVVAEVERGEDHLKAKFEDALKDDALSPTTREIVQAVWPSVQQGHDEMSQLKHTLEASA